MANHNFSFAGGDILSKMGATWFVSYAYYDRVDKNHRNWDRVSTAASRTSRYIAGIPYHKEWLQEVLVMKDENLSKNTIVLDARQVKAMAKEIWTTGNKNRFTCFYILWIRRNAPPRIPLRVKIRGISFAGVVELVDSVDLGSSA